MLFNYKLYKILLLEESGVFFLCSSSVYKSNIGQSEIMACIVLQKKGWQAPVE